MLTADMQDLVFLCFFISHGAVDGHFAELFQHIQ